MIKLCYKEYEYKLTHGASKSFSDETGLDLEIVLQDYIVKDIEMYNRPDTNRIGLNVALGKLYPKKVVCYALFSIIKPCHPEVSLDEICDGVHRVGWELSDRPDDMGESWPMVMKLLAYDHNDYCNNNMPANTKKKVTDI